MASGFSKCVCSFTGHAFTCIHTLIPISDLLLLVEEPRQVEVWQPQLASFKSIDAACRPETQKTFPEMFRECRHEKGQLASVARRTPPSPQEMVMRSAVCMHRAGIGVWPFLGQRQGGAHGPGCPGCPGLQGARAAKATDGCGRCGSLAFVVMP